MTGDRSHAGAEIVLASRKGDQPPLEGLAKKLTGAITSQDTTLASSVP